MILRFITSEVCAPKAVVDNTNRGLDKSQYHTKTKFNHCFIIYVQKVERYYIIEKTFLLTRRTSVHTSSFLIQENAQIMSE